ncbi:MAG: TIGR03619 family F420-dependent LLM class oxidoreductase [Acidimicrobiia bacterium]
MKFHVPLPGNNHIPGYAEWIPKLQAPDWQTIAAVIDECGYDAISTSEHIAMPDYERDRLGGWWMHALTVMAFICGATKNTRVDTSVLVLPYHHPVALAKAIATMDVLSGGRVNVSIGVGHAVQEFKVLNVPFDDRGPRTDEMLDAMLAFWASSEPVFHGRFFDIEGVISDPRPIQLPHPPIIVGGNSKAAMRRASRYQGWIPNPLTITGDELPPQIEFIKSQPTFGDPSRPFDISLGVRGLGDRAWPKFRAMSGADKSSLKEYLVDMIGKLGANGVNVTSVPPLPTESVDEYCDSLRWVAQEVVAACR